MPGVSGLPRRHGARLVRLSWLLLVAPIAMSTGCSSVTSAEDMPGTLNVVIVPPGFPSGIGVTVTLTGPAGFEARTASTNFGGTVTFTELPPGTYIIATTAFAFDCQPVSAEVEELQTSTVDVVCTRTTGTVTGTVTDGGSPINGATVRLSRAGVEQTRMTGATGTFSFVVAAGQYQLTATSQHFDCSVQTVIVAMNQTTTVDIACTPSTSGSIAGRVLLHEGHLIGADVALSGPVSGITSSNFFGGFSFDDLPPGTYTVTASLVGFGCDSATVEVQAARTTTADINCEFRFPLGTEIQGNWQYFRAPPDPTGNCPTPLPEQATGSMTFNPANDTLVITGLDPALSISGIYDEESAIFMGSGTTVLGDGSSIRSDLAVFFYFDFEFFFGVVSFFTDGFTLTWTRQHRDPSGNLVCTELYNASGFRLE